MKCRGDVSWKVLRAVVSRAVVSSSIGAGAAMTDVVDAAWRERDGVIAGVSPAGVLHRATVLPRR